MIKKALITKAYQINLYCDKCGKRMEIDKEKPSLLSNPPIFTYRCECGHTEQSKQIYPYQQVFFDEENAEEMSEVE